MQAVVRHGRRIPLHGGVADPNGEFNALYTDFIAGKGFTEPYLGSSYVQVVTWNKSPCPNAVSILTYSESTNPRSRHLSDQTLLYSQKRWVTDPFCVSAVRAATVTTTLVTSGRRTVTYSARRTKRRHRHHR